MHVNLTSVQFSSVQSLSRVWLFATPWNAARQASLSITNSRRLLKLMSIESGMPSSHLILWRPLLLQPPIPPSIRVFSNESTLHMRWPKYWSFSFSISPSHEHPGLTPFRMDWLDLFAVQGTLKSLLQHHSSKASILRHSAFFTQTNNSTPNYLPNRNESMRPHEVLSVNAHLQQRYSCYLQLQTTQLFVNGWTDNQNVLYPYNGILQQ